jgi:hypothetical protein
VAGRVRTAVAVVDTSALYALVDGAEPAHRACVEALDAMAGTILQITAFVLAEADYLIATRLGIDAELAFLRDVESGAYRLAEFDATDVASCLPVIERYRDLGIGLADASNVVVADRMRTRRIFTLDRRRFVAVRPLRGGRFDVVP